MTLAKWEQEWVDALRSGKFPQGRGHLKEAGGRYCCLGVLCELQGASTIGGFPSIHLGLKLEIEEWAVLVDGQLFYLTYLNDAGARRPEHGDLPEPLRKWAGPDGNVPPLTFDQIADCIEHAGGLVRAEAE